MGLCQKKARDDTIVGLILPITLVAREFEVNEKLVISGHASGQAPYVPL